MNLIIANRLVLPWTLFFASLLSGFLYMISGGISLSEIAYAAQSFGEESTSSESNLNSEGPSFTDCAVSMKYPQSILQWCNLITYYANKNGLHPDLVAGLIWQESGGNSLAYSKSGAVGLMQVMPRDGLAASFNCPNGPCFKDRPTIVQLQEPEFNISFGTQMLSGLVSRHGSIREGLKRYGPMDVGYYYADKVLSIFHTYGAG